MGIALHDQVACATNGCVPRILPALFLLLTALLVSQAPPPQPLVIPLQCAGGDCPLLKGAPQTTGMRSGFVRLGPGKSVGWHSTGQNEESLVILVGKGQALIEGQRAREVEASQLVYIPPATRHNITNTGSQFLEYVYVVAPAAAPHPNP